MSIYCHFPPRRVGLYIYIYLFCLQERHSKFSGIYMGALDILPPSLAHRCLQVIRRHMKELGYNFFYATLDSIHYMLPQRRNRVWGVVSLITPQETFSSHLQEHYRDCLASMKTNFQFPISMNFPPKKKEKPRTQHHERLIEGAREGSFGLREVFVDCNPSLKRQAYVPFGIPCVMPNHQVYYLRQERYLQGVDFMNAQGLWPCGFRPEVYQKLLGDPVLAQSLAGNSFSSTVNQAVLIASLICCESPWMAVAQSQPGRRPAERPGHILKRIRSKRPAPEYQPPAQNEDRRNARELRNKQRVTGTKRMRRRNRNKHKGIDMRKNSTGKKDGASIWHKEQVCGAQGWEFGFCVCIYIYMELHLYCWYIYIYNVHVCMHGNGRIRSAAAWFTHLSKMTPAVGILSCRHSMLAASYERKTHIYIWIRQAL